MEGLSEHTKKGRHHVTTLPFVIILYLYFATLGSVGYFRHTALIDGVVFRGMQ